MLQRAFVVITTALLASVLATAMPASAFETYKVVGVPAGDKLIVREEPQEGGTPADWKEVASIPANAATVLGTGRSKEVNKQRWSEVAVGDATGWVNARFLTAADAPPDLKEATFDCFGTEPFWGVTLGPKEGELSEPESKIRADNRERPARDGAFVSAALSVEEPQGPVAARDRHAPDLLHRRYVRLRLRLRGPALGRRDVPPGVLFYKEVTTASDAVARSVALTGA